VLAANVVEDRDLVGQNAAGEDPEPLLRRARQSGLA
jgi:hypothetical protein